jgi:hypothetical protein
MKKVFLIIMIVINGLNIYGDGIGKFSLETSIIDPFFNIYFVRSEYSLSMSDNAVFGLYFLTGDTALFGDPYPGDYTLFSAQIGYKKYVWDKIYISYLLIPGVAVYKDKNQSKEYLSFEVWNEMHLGNKFQITMDKTILFISSEVLIGISIIKTNEPNSFKIIEENEPAFGVPDLYILPNICLGMQF